MKNNHGNWEEHTQWHHVVTRGKRAENCAKFLNKGDRIYIEGQIKKSSWQDSDNNTHWKSEIHADDVKFITQNTKELENVESIEEKNQKLIGVEECLNDEKKHLDFDKEYKKELEQDFKIGKIDGVDYEKGIAGADCYITQREIEIKRLKKSKKSLAEEIDALESPEFVGSVLCGNANLLKLHSLCFAYILKRHTTVGLDSYAI